MGGQQSGMGGSGMGGQQSGMGGQQSGMGGSGMGGSGMGGDSYGSGGQTSGGLGQDDSYGVRLWISFSRVTLLTQRTVQRSDRRRPVGWDELGLRPRYFRWPRLK